jgi:hypothetical protein
MHHLKTVILCGLATILFFDAPSQVLRRVGNRAAEKLLNKKVDEAIDGQTNQNNPNNSSSPSNNNSGNNRSNNGGEGLISTPPDVKENLNNAETAFKAGNYNDARYSVQQAMLGVELEIGHKILKSFPKTVARLKPDTLKDQVTSSGWGWNGLAIKREYSEGEKEFTITIANNAVWMQALNYYFNNAQSTGGQQKVKQVRVKGYKALIEYENNSGYKLSVPLGQTSLVVFEGVNFKTEKEMMDAANEIDLDGIKNNLGEK